jgi:hypothetical protein
MLDKNKKTVVFGEVRRTHISYVCSIFQYRVDLEKGTCYAVPGEFLDAICSCAVENLVAGYQNLQFLSEVLFGHIWRQITKKTEGKRPKPPECIDENTGNEQKTQNLPNKMSFPTFVTMVHHGRTNMMSGVRFCIHVWKISKLKPQFGF